MLKIKNLTKKFDGLVALDNLSLDVAAGEIFVCIGPNGSGKTTTVKMLAGLYIPSSGEITIGGIDPAEHPEDAKRLNGYIPDEPFIYEKMSGREFLGFIGALFGMKQERAALEAKKYLHLFPGLEEVIDGFVENYSRGNKQKLAVVAALLHQPKVLLVDEPMVGLDPQSMLAVKKILKEFAESGGTVFLCTHTLPVAQDLAHRIGVLEKGKLIAIGTLTELRRKIGNPSADLEEVYLEITKHQYWNNQ